MTDQPPTTSRPCPFSPRVLRAAAALGRRAALVLAVLAAGSAPGSAQVADPPEGGAENGTFDGLLRALDLKPKLAPVPDFVRASRPPAGRTDYIPVGRAHPERPVKLMTPAELQAATAALDSDRIAQQRRAGLKPPAVPLKKPKGFPILPPKTNVP